MKRWPLVASFILFIVLCASAAYWAMQLFKPPLRAVAAPPPSVQPAPQLDAAAGLFGGRTNVAVASNYQLKGVVVSGNESDSVAILATDGKPAQSVRINAEIMPGVTVKEVHRRYVLLSEGGVVKRVELPEDAKGQTQVNLSTNAPALVRGAMTPSPTSSLPSRTPTPSPQANQQLSPQTAPAAQTTAVTPHAPSETENPNAPGMGTPSDTSTGTSSVPPASPAAAPLQPQQR
jgi:general secretion pathway protein C